MPDDFQSRSMLKEIDRALEQRHLDRALSLAHKCYDENKQFRETDLMLLSITFSATIRWGVGLDLVEKRLAQKLWREATLNMSQALKIEAANNSIRLAEIYLGRKEFNLAHSALHIVKGFVVPGPLSLRYNTAVDSYVALSGRPDTDLWIN